MVKALHLGCLALEREVHQVGRCLSIQHAKISMRIQILSGDAQFANIKVLQQLYKKNGIDCSAACTKCHGVCSNMSISPVKSQPTLNPANRTILTVKSCVKAAASMRI